MSTNNAEFELGLVWSDKRIQIAADVSALDGMINAGVPVEPGCRSGGCGECATPYVEGDVVHKDSCLSEKDWERMFCPCVLRARGTLALPY